MYSYEKRMKAVELYIKYDLCAADTIRELGYPSRKVLIRWYKEYQETRDLHRQATRQMDWDVIHTIYSVFETKYGGERLLAELSPEGIFIHTRPNGEDLVENSNRTKESRRRYQICLQSKLACVPDSDSLLVTSTKPSIARHVMHNKRTPLSSEESGV